MEPLSIDMSIYHIDIIIYLGTLKGWNFCLNPEIQLRGASGGISACGRFLGFGRIFRNLRRAIPISAYALDTGLF